MKSLLYLAIMSCNNLALPENDKTIIELGSNLAKYHDLSCAPTDKIVFGK